MLVPIANVSADTPTKTGEDGVAVSPVYSLAVQYQSLWLLSGDETGAITLQSVRHSEGNRIATLRHHTSAVSVLTLSPDERSVLSGSWDKTICDWDLNTGQVRREFASTGGQISAIELRPLSSVPVPANDAPAEELVPNGTFFANTGAFARASLQHTSHAMDRSDSNLGSHSGGGLTPRHEDDLLDGSHGVTSHPDGDGELDGAGTFDGDDGDMDSLFGDDSAPALRGLGAGGDDDLDNGLDELTRAIREDQRAPGDVDDDDFALHHHHAEGGGGSGDALMPDAKPDDPAVAYSQATPAAAAAEPSSEAAPPDATKPTSAAADAMAAATLTAAPTSNPTADSTTSTSTAKDDGSAGAPTDATTATAAAAPRTPSLALSSAPDRAHLSPTTFLSASIDGTLRIWDLRAPRPATSFPSTPTAASAALPAGSAPARATQSASLRASRGAPPWCMSAVWSPSGNAIYAGRRNSAVDEYLLHAASASAARALAARLPARTFRFPGPSKAVSALRPFPNGRHLMCASHDILRLYDVAADDEGGGAGGGGGGGGGKVPFLIVPGHRSGVVSQLYLDPTCRFMLSAAGNRGWEEASTEVLLGYEIGVPGAPVVTATPAGVVN
jgi:transcriptional activator SPT8